MSIWDEVIEPAINQADDNASDEWKDRATLCVIALAWKQKDFTADDVLEMLGERYPDVSTHNTAALGPVMLGLKRKGVIRQTGEMRQSRLKQRHRKLTVWEVAK